MEELDGKKMLALEQYKEIKASRRHYSNLRFALFPVFFVVQSGVLQISLKSMKNELLFQDFIQSGAGILVTYGFWTIENRIRDYYIELETAGHQIEELLEFDHKMMEKYSKTTFFNSTKLSIKTVYAVFMIYWVVTFILQCVELFK